MKEERNRIRQYLPADRYRRNRHDRVGNLRIVRGYRPDGSGRDKGTLQERGIERVRHRTPCPLIGRKQHRGLRPRNDNRPRFPYRIVRGGESPQSVVGEDNAPAKRENDGYRICRCRHRAEPPMDGVTVCRSGYQFVIQSHGHTFIRSYRRTDGKGLFPDRRKAEQSFPFTKAKQARGFPSAARSGGYAVRGTISTLMLRVVFFP